jgi:hypothetical protein
MHIAALVICMTAALLIITTLAAGSSPTADNHHHRWQQQQPSFRVSTRGAWQTTSRRVATCNYIIDEFLPLQSYFGRTSRK